MNNISKWGDELSAIYPTIEQKELAFKWLLHFWDILCSLQLFCWKLMNVPREVIATVVVQWIWMVLMTFCAPLKSGSTMRYLHSHLIYDLLCLKMSEFPDNKSSLPKCRMKGILISHELHKRIGIVERVAYN